MLRGKKAVDSFLAVSFSWEFNSSPKDLCLKVPGQRRAGFGMMKTLTGLLRVMVPSIELSVVGKRSVFSSQVGLGAASLLL